LTTSTRTQVGRAFRVNSHTDVWSIRRKRRRGRRVIDYKHSNPDRTSLQGECSYRRVEYTEEEVKRQEGR